MGLIDAILTPAGPYPDNPLCGPRPMKYPYTITAKFAQFPFRFLWRYSPWFRFFFYGLIPNFYIFYKIQKLSYTPSNVEEWKIKRHEWYAVKYPPEYDLY